MSDAANGSGCDLHEGESVSGGSIGVITLFSFLVGNRNAILTVAQSRWAIVVGAMFVLAAGFAREYDGESLLDEPWHLAIPFGASLVAASILYLLVFGAAAIRRQPPVRFFSGWCRFVTLIWMTAPLAWLYAIPYERMFSEVGAVQANLWTLALVAFWRVALMARGSGISGIGEGFNATCQDRRCQGSSPRTSVGRLG